MSQFYNPYHFVPVKGSQGPDDLPVSQLMVARADHPVRHDRFVSESAGSQRVFSGRLICRLTTEDPVVIGSQQERVSQDQPARIEPFELDGRPAIPASTLRGMISAVAEAASNSALRVLEDRAFSYRTPIQTSLSAIGMIVEHDSVDGAKEFRLRPLALPTMQVDRGVAWLPDNYKKMFPLDRTPPLKLYIGDSKSIRSESFAGNLPFRSYSSECPEYCYAKLFPRSWDPGHALVAGPSQHLSGNGQFLLSQQTTDGSCPITEIELPQDEQERGTYTRGILRVLGAPGRPDIPTTKKHELFIPYTNEAEEIEAFPILEEAIARFYRLADARTVARQEEPFLPYEPKGTKRNLQPKGPEDRWFRLKHGDLVYFLPNSRGDQVEEISLSSIWRRWAGSAHQYFRLLSPEKLPFHRGRQYLSIAEQLFGFVEQRHPGVQPGAEESLALASRLRFSFGHLYPEQKGNYYDPEVSLKILDSPKPPLPSFYFRYKTGPARYIPTRDLPSNPSPATQYIPQGRKFYLHRWRQDHQPWRTLAEEDRPQQKSKVRPLKAGLRFYFHIDFDNLSERELSLLCYAIRPADEFRHKLGMGKPLGLGKVRLDPVGIFLVDRKRRYQETSLFESFRYHSAWVALAEKSKEWPDIYATERRCTEKDMPMPVGFEELRQAFQGTMDGDIRQALELLADPAKIRHPVRTPQVAGRTGPELEQETYLWFVQNQRSAIQGRRPQFLVPLTKDTIRLPTLDEEWKE